jgi:trans-aconitate 2-methyltransferase
MTSEQHGGDATRRRPRGRYAFGDVEAASLRLQLMDRAMAWPSRALVDVVGRPAGLVVDLGCGPGFTTRRLAERLLPARVVGLDNSRPFLAQAAAAMPEVEWIEHDVTTVPFPTGPADVLHARFVLSHLADSAAVLTAWLHQLRRGGFLLVMEDDAIATEDPVLNAYEAMARSLVGHRGGDLWVGARLAAVAPPAGFHTVVNRVDDHRIPIALAAQLFSLNFGVWRRDPFITDRYRASELDGLDAALSRLCHAEGDGEVVFSLRQLAYRRDKETATAEAGPADAAEAVEAASRA